MSGPAAPGPAAAGEPATKPAASEPEYPCVTCIAECCRNYLVPVTGLDVYRIYRSLGLDPGQFTAYQQLASGKVGFRLEDSALRYTMLLAKDQQHGRASEGWCVFWLPLGKSVGRCGIYQLRPRVCRTYPARLENGTVQLPMRCLKTTWNADVPGAPWQARAEREDAERRIDDIVNQRWNSFDPAAEPAVDPIGDPTVSSTDRDYRYRRYLAWMLEIYARLDPSITDSEGELPPPAELRPAIEVALAVVG